MPADENGEKTEAPTQRRRDEARKRGQMARSRDLSSVAILLAAIGALNLLGGRIFTQLGVLMERLLAAPDGSGWDLIGAGETLRSALWGVVMIVGPLLAAVTVAAAVANVMQVGLVFTGEPLKPNLSKISPLAGLKRMVSKRAAVRLLMSLGKVAIIGGISYVTITGRITEIVSASGLGFQQIVAVGGQLVFLLVIRVAVVLLVLAVMDYLFQRWQHEQDLKMTRQELREDLKRMEGDPHIRSRRQRIARQLAMQRMSLEVPRSTVVVTNPTHLAVALLYNEDMNAPKVIAKGADLIAVRIRQIASASGVPIVERKPLAQALYKSCRVGDEIPVSLYQTVAEVLAYVYELTRHKKIGRVIPAGIGT